MTTGASNDIKRATEIARNMVTKWGLSERLGPLTYGEDEGEVFLGHSVGTRKEDLCTIPRILLMKKCAKSLNVTMNMPKTFLWNIWIFCIKWQKL